MNNKVTVSVNSTREGLNGEFFKIENLGYEENLYGKEEFASKVPYTSRNNQVINKRGGISVVPDRVVEEKATNTNFHHVSERTRHEEINEERSVKMGAVEAEVVSVDVAAEFDKTYGPDVVFAYEA